VYGVRRVKTLDTLARAAHAELLADGAQIVTGIACDSRTVERGELFVSLEPEADEAREYLAVAVERGASAICLPRGLSALAPAGLPLLLVDDARAALAQVSAAFFDCPAGELTLVGITGTLGKTSTAALMQAALARASAGAGVGVIGSLGASVRGRGADDASALPDVNGMTTPDAPTLHRAMRAFADAGIATVIMEITSHALAQQRVHGLRCALGVFTNLVPDEHLEFHATPADYVRTKALFFEHLEHGAPVIYAADDPLVASLVRQAAAQSGCIPVGVVVPGGDAEPLPEIPPAVFVTGLTWDSGGSRFTLELHGELPRIGGPALSPVAVPLSLPLLGVQHVTNATLAATAALCAGAHPDDVAAAFATAPAVHRRMEVVRRRNPGIIDDTTGNPETLRAVFTTVAAIPHSGLRVVFGLRGSRGPAINARLARTLAEVTGECASREPVRLVVTSSEEVADDRNRVTAEERDAVFAALGEAVMCAGAGGGLRFDFVPRLQDAIRTALADVRDGEVVLLLGAQGMNEAAAIAEGVLSERDATHGPPAAAEESEARPSSAGPA
jgi:UDP-N-acetylmuramoyl-L-alanyl-D-glutamate--2,6-diaminopimelate ligase